MALWDWRDVGANLTVVSLVVIALYVALQGARLIRRRRNGESKKPTDDEDEGGI